MNGGYSEEIFYALSSIAESISKPNNGFCSVLFEERTDDGRDHAIIKFAPAYFAQHQDHPVLFYAVVSKWYNEPASLFLLQCRSDAEAIRTGIAKIDVMRGEVKPQPATSVMMPDVDSHDDIAF